MKTSAYIVLLPILAVVKMMDFKIAGEEHILSLLADDLLLFMCDPDPELLL